MDYLMEVKVLKMMHIGTQFNGWKDLQMDGGGTLCSDCGRMDGRTDKRSVSCEQQKT